MLAYCQVLMLLKTKHHFQFTDELLEDIVCGHEHTPVRRFEYDNEKPTPKDHIDLAFSPCLETIRFVVDVWKIDLHSSFATKEKALRKRLKEVLGSGEKKGEASVLINKIKRAAEMNEHRANRYKFNPKIASLGDALLYTAVMCDNVSLMQWLVQDKHINPLKKIGGSTALDLASKFRSYYAIKFIFSNSSVELEALDCCFYNLLADFGKDSDEKYSYSRRTIGSSVLSFLLRQRETRADCVGWALENWENIAHTSIRIFEFRRQIENKYIEPERKKRLRMNFNSLYEVSSCSRNQQVKEILQELGWMETKEIGDGVLKVVGEESCMVMSCFVFVMQKGSQELYIWMRDKAFRNQLEWWELIFDYRWDLNGTTIKQITTPESEWKENPVYLPSMVTDEVLRNQMRKEKILYTTYNNFHAARKNNENAFSAASVSKTFSRDVINRIVLRARGLLQEKSALLKMIKEMRVEKNNQIALVSTSYGIKTYKLYLPDTDSYPMVVAKFRHGYALEIMKRGGPPLILRKIWISVYSGAVGMSKLNEEQLIWLLKDLGFAKTPYSRILHLLAFGAANSHAINILCTLNPVSKEKMKNDRNLALEVLYCHREISRETNLIFQSKDSALDFMLWDDLKKLMITAGVGMPRNGLDIMCVRKKAAHPDPYNLRSFKTLLKNGLIKLNFDSKLRESDGKKILRSFLSILTHVKKGERQDKYCNNRLVDHEQIIRVVQYFEKCGVQLSPDWPEWANLIKVSKLTSEWRLFEWMILKRGIGITMNHNDVGGILDFDGDRQNFIRILNELQKQFKLANAVGEGITVERFEKLVKANHSKDIGESIRSARNKLGQGLLEIAILNGNIKMISHLALHYGLDPSGPDRDGKDLRLVAKDCLNASCFGTFTNIVKSHKKRNKSVILIQSVQRGHITRRKYSQVLRQRCDERKEMLPVWGPLIQFIQRLEAKGMKLTFGPSWEEIRSKISIGRDGNHRTDLEALKIFNERKDFGEQAGSQLESAAKLTDDDNDPLDDKKEEQKHQRSEATATRTHHHRSPGIEEAKSSDNDSISNLCARDVLISRSARRRIQRYGGRYWTMFWSRISRLSSGDRSYAMSKRLNNSKRTIFETKLDSGMRILWTESGNTIVVRYVCKHDEVPHHIQLIDRSYVRMKIDGSDSGAADTTTEEVKDSSMRHENENVVLNPEGNTPVRFYEIPAYQLSGMLSMDVKFVHTWKPKLHLTKREKDAVEREGMVLLRGRSGTGKTWCICSRMQRDFDYHHGRSESIRTNSEHKDAHQQSSRLRQVFIAGTQRLVKYVRELQHNLGFHDDPECKAEYLTMSGTIERLQRNVRLDSQFQRTNRVSYVRFRDELWPSIQQTIFSSAGTKSKKKKSQVKKQPSSLQALTVWTQIRSCIKGSHRVCRGFVERNGTLKPLTREEYFNLGRRESHMNQGYVCIHLHMYVYTHAIVCVCV